MKICSKCKIEKDLSLFFRKGDKHQSSCKECAKKYAKKYNANNAKKIAEKTAEYRREHSCEIKEWQKKHYLENKQKITIKAAEYYRKNEANIRKRVKTYYEDNKKIISIKNAERLKKNPSIKIRSEAKRRAKKANNGGKLSVDIIEKLIILQNATCIVCRCKLTKYHLDHIMPLSAGGENSDNNVQLLCPTCNMRKHAKHPIKFMQENGFLL